MGQDLEQLSDWQLVELARSGNSAAFEVLVARRRGLLCAIVARRAPWLLRRRLLDPAINETWYQVWRRVVDGDYRTSVRFTSWLTGLCWNVLKQKQFRPLGPSLVVGGAHGEQLARDPPDQGETPPEAAERAERLLALKQCLGERPELEQRVFELRFVDGLPKTVAAQALGCSDVYVGKVERRLIEALARCMARKGFRPKGRGVDE